MQFARSVSVPQFVQFVATLQGTQLDLLAGRINRLNRE